jgi:glycogen phosphorylase
LRGEDDIISSDAKVAARQTTRKPGIDTPLDQYEVGPVRLHAGDDYDRHLVFDHVVSLEDADQRERFEAVARSLRDLLAQRWLLTQKTQDEANAKRVCYLSMEFLLGRSLANNIVNLGVQELVRHDLASDPRQDWHAVLEAEPDAGLGNGGLGRLAACFLDSLATMHIPATGYGLRYEYGIFRQAIENGWQVERPDPWLLRPDPWEVRRPRETVHVPLGCSFALEAGRLRVVRDHPSWLLGVPYDRPVVGYGGGTINSLRLWGAASPDYFDFGEFSSGDFVGALVDRMAAETVTRVLYPDDSTLEGHALRFLQEYFLVCCSLADIVQRFRRGNDWQALPDKVAIQLNDTHPAMAVAELMRILLDEAGLGWGEAWQLTVGTLAYTNHTLLPEALEKWPVSMFEILAPRLLQIICEINRRFLDDVGARWPGDGERRRRMSLIEEAPARQVRMAHLAVVGARRTNGVAKLHSELLRTRVLKDFAEIWPERFTNKTNGVTPRRWLLLANPGLAGLITEAIGDGWITDLGRLADLLPLADDAAFRARFQDTRRAAKVAFAGWLKQSTGQVVDPATIFDSQIKRIHAYKRQLLNLLHIVVLYNRLRADPGLDLAPRTFFFAGKAAPAYRLAKLIIKLANGIAARLAADRATRGCLNLVFVPDYGVSVAQRLIPASDVSQQISTAGYEASGTSNMKLMMNGALTVGTRDGATIEIAEAAGEDNVFLFGLSAAQVEGSRGWYSPWWHYQNEPETRAALDLIRADHFNPDEPGIFQPIWNTLLTEGDYYMHLADFSAYAAAQGRIDALYRDPESWARKAIVNVARAGRFSSDRTIAEYAAEIWHAAPCPIP